MFLSKKIEEKYLFSLEFLNLEDDLFSHTDKHVH